MASTGTLQELERGRGYRSIRFQGATLPYKTNSHALLPGSKVLGRLSP